MRDARPCRHAMATRGGDEQEADAPLPSFPRAVLTARQLARPTGAQCHGEARLHPHWGEGGGLLSARRL